MSTSEAALHLRDIADLLRSYRMAQTTEFALQDAIADVLTAEEVDFEREVIITAADRPDFMATPGICIEVKVKGPVSQVRRQLERYAENERVTAILLVTTRREHVVPSEMMGKPVLTLCVGSAFL